MDSKILISNYKGRPVNPTNRIIAKRARDSSGSTPLYDFINNIKLINFLVLGRIW
jgi:hypothetical protein